MIAGPNLAQIRRIYNRGASRYDRWQWAFRLAGVTRLRRAVLRQARGKVLEVAVGTGQNLPYYPPVTSVTAIDLSEGMLQRARARAQGLGLSISLAVMQAENLSFPDQSFDTVISSLGLCTFVDPIAALGEMSRVCRQDGCILLLEHGASSWRFLAHIQDRLQRPWAASSGCHLNRQPIDFVQRTGLSTIHLQRALLGMLYSFQLARQRDDHPS